MHWAITCDPWPQQAPWGEMTRACSYSAGTRERSKTQGEDICKVSVYICTCYGAFILMCEYHSWIPPFTNAGHHQLIPRRTESGWPVVGLRDGLGVGVVLNVDFNYKHLFPVTSQWTWREFSWIKTHTYMYFFQKCNCNIVSVFEDSDLQWSAHFFYDILSQRNCNSVKIKIFIEFGIWGYFLYPFG